MGSAQETRSEVLERYGLEAARLADLRELALAPGETLLRQGTAMDCLYLVLRGTARVSIFARNGKNLIICYYVSAGILGDVELMGPDRAATTTVAAVSPLRVLCIPMESNRAYLTGNTAFLNAVGASLAEKLVKSSGAYAAAALCTSEERLCAYIRMNARGGVFADVLTEVAQSVGVSYRHLFRLMGELCAEGVLEKTASGYRILDPARLRERAAE